jgi:hypothetical protein
MQKEGVMQEEGMKWDERGRGRWLNDLGLASKAESTCEMADIAIRLVL